MTIADYMPVRLGLLDRTTRPARKHRAADKADRLQFLLDGANLYIRGLHLQLDDQERKHEATIARIDARYTATIRELEDRLAELQQRLDVGVRAEAAVTKTQPIPVVVPVRPYQVPAAPEPLADRFDSGPVRRAGATPHAVTNPGHPSWAVRDEPEPAA